MIEPTELVRRCVGRDFSRLPAVMREPLVRSKRRRKKRRSFEQIKGGPIDPVSPVNFTEKLMLRVLQDYPVPHYEVIENKITAPWYARSKTARPLRVAECYGFWRNPTFEDLDVLPNSFVLKSTHGCGSVRVVRDKESTDLRAAVTHLVDHNRRLRDPVGNKFNAYIMAEGLLHDGKGGIPRDLKFHCFNRSDGSFEWFLQIVSGRFAELRIDYFDSELCRVPWSLHADQTSDGPVDLPANIDDFVGMARDLSADFDYIRIDLYDIDGEVTFGEFTPTPAEGDYWITPRTYETVVGALWDWDPTGHINSGFDERSGTV